MEKYLYDGQKSPEAEMQFTPCTVLGGNQMLMDGKP